MKIFKTLLPVLLCLIFLVGCSAGKSSDGAARAVETYMHALVDRDENRAITAACADWESQAKVEYNSFSAVKLQLDGLSCQVSGVEAPYTLVRCSGTITANYGAEDLTIDIASRTYRAIQEGGEWRMCGYGKQ